MFSNTLEFFATGCTWQINYSGDKNLKLEGKILDKIAKFESRYSRFIKNSFLDKLGAGGVFKLTTQDKYLFKVYSNLYTITKGKFSPLIGTNLIRSGYDKNYSLKAKKLVKLPNIKNVYTIKNFIINVKKGYNFDFGGIGKGYLIDQIYLLLKKNSIKTFLIDGSGDIRYYDYMNRKIYIGLNDASGLKDYLGYIYLQSSYSVCGSATDKRKWRDMTHIIDGKNNTYPSKVISTFVLSKSALYSDALATCLFFVNPKKLLQSYSFEYLVVKKNSIDKSKNFNLNSV